MHIQYNFTRIVIAYIIAIIIFIISATIIVYYSFGYRYNFSQNKIEPTGILHLYPTDNRCQIALNNQAVDNSQIGASTDITNLAPGQYLLDISCDQYLKWQKEITIEPNKITNENDIMLIPMHPKSSELSYIDQYSFNRYNQLLAYLSDNHIMILNFLSEKNQTIDNIEINKSTEINWISNNLLAITNNNPESTNIKIVNPYNNNVSQFTIPHSIKATDILGTMPLGESIIIYYSSPNIYLFDITNGNSPRELIHDVYHPIIINGSLYYSPSDTSSTSLFAQNLTLQTTSQYNFPNPITNLKLISNNTILVQSDNDQSTLYDLSNKSSLLSTDNIINASISPDSKKIAVGKSNSLNIFSTSNNITNENIIIKDQNIDVATFIDNTNIIYESNSHLNSIDYTGQNNQIIETDKSDEIIYANAQKILTIEHINGQRLLKYIYLKH